ncbi:MAG: replication initiator protein A [Eubacteriales bacterium]
MFEKKQDNHIRVETKLPQYIPVPQFLVPMKLSQTAKLLYGVLLSRTTLSQKNNMIDEKGNVYVIYPIQQLALHLNRTEMTIKNAIQELVGAQLLEKRRRGFGMPNHLYILLPMHLIYKANEKGNIRDKKTSVLREENNTCEGKNMHAMTERKLSPNYYKNTNKRTTIYDYEEGESL